MKSNVLVSIGLPAYNSAERLPGVLDSLLGQTYSNFELIISDDGSSDETERICREYAERDRRVRYIRQPRNIGRIANFLFVLGEAKGVYFMWAADDDWWDRRFLETLAVALDSHPGHKIAMSSYRRVYTDGSLKDRVLFSGSDDLTQRSSRWLFKKMIAGEPLHNFFCGLWRREFIAALFSRPVPEVISWDRVVMAEAALAARFVSVRPELFIKRKKEISIKKRHASNPERERHQRPFAYLRYIAALATRPLTSPLVPFSRKLFIPVLWLGLLWRERKRIFSTTLRDFRKIYD